VYHGAAACRKAATARLMIGPRLATGILAVGLRERGIPPPPGYVLRKSGKCRTCSRRVRMNVKTGGLIVSIFSEIRTLLRSVQVHDATKLRVQFCAD
jgi:hypothetical protein